MVISGSAPVLQSPGTKSTLILNLSEQSRSYSSVYNNNAIGTGYARSMIDSDQTWAAGSNNTSQWLIMDIGEEKTIIGVQIQGSKTHNVWVKTFKVSYYSDNTYIYTDSEKTYTVPTQDRNTKNNILFDSSITARYLKIHPQTWQGHISMRTALLLPPINI